MIISKLIQYTLIAAACVSTLTLSSCGSDSSSSSSSSENTLDLISPYDITLQWGEGNEVLNMRPSTAIDGSVNIDTLLDLADATTQQGIYEWVTFPNAETQQAELVCTHVFMTLSPRSSSVYTYTIYFTFSDPTTATATIKLVKVTDGSASPEEWIHDRPVTFSRPLY